MAQAHRTIRIVTNDEALFASARGAAASLTSWRMAEPQSVEDLLSSEPEREDVILLDAWLRTENVYESLRRLTGRARCRTYVVVDERNVHAESLASFCGATGVIHRPISGETLRNLLDETGAPRKIDSDDRGAELERALPESLVRDLVGDKSTRLLDALTDPETGLYSYEYLTFKLDEEFKRAVRFKQPLSCVMLGFEGQADEEVLARLASVFLNASRDTDVLGRFDQSSFLFFLPNTGPDGAAVMARRIRESAEEQELVDLVGDALDISVGISFCPHPRVTRREDLFSRARDAFHAAQHEGGAVVTA